MGVVGDDGQSIPLRTVGSRLYVRTVWRRVAGLNSHRIPMASFDYRITPAQHAAFERDGAVFLKSVVTGGLLDRPAGRSGTCESLRGRLLV